MSDRVPDLDLGGHFALGPWRVRRAGYGVKQLASDGVFGAAPGSLRSLARAAYRGGQRPLGLAPRRQPCPAQLLARASRIS